MIKKILCKIGIHLKCRHTMTHIVCDICGYKKDRYEHQADLHSGGGW